MKFKVNSNGLSLVKDNVELFCDLKAYIMTEKDEKTYLDFVFADDKTAEFSLTELGAKIKVVLEDVNSSCAVRFIADYNPEKLFSKKNNLHFYDEHALGLEMAPSSNMQKGTAIYKHCEFWSRPFFFEKMSELPETTQALMLVYQQFNLCAAALCDKEFKGNFIGGEEGKFCLYVWDNCKSNQCDTLAAVFASSGAQWDVLVPKTLTDGFVALGKEPLLRKDKKLPNVLNYIGWCTWDALHLDVSHEALLEKAEEFKEKQIPVKWVMIDDMWGHVKNNALGVNSSRELYDFEADPDRFPKGLAAAVSDLKNYNLTVGLWHPTTGYWRGIDMRGNIAKNPQFRELLFLSQFGFWTHSFEEEKIEKYFMLQHKFYKDCGIDFVKIDNQACLRRWAKLVMPIGKAAANMHRAIEKAADTYYDSQLINCMGMPLENFWNRKSAVSRMSCDYLPDSAERFNLLVQQNTFNSMVQGQVYYGDYDMWWTYDSQALKNAAIHSICGGPVYISDEIGKTNYDVIKPLIFSDGRVIRMENPAYPTADCMHINSTTSGKPFKAYNKSENGGVVVAYNIDVENRAVKGTVCAMDAGLCGDKYYCAYDRFSGESYYLKGDEKLEVTLDDNNQFKMFLFVPCENGAIIGLKEKYVCFELIKNNTVLEDGTLLLFKTDKLSINGNVVNASPKGNNLFEIAVNKGDLISL